MLHLGPVYGRWKPPGSPPALHSAPIEGTPERMPQPHCQESQRREGVAAARAPAHPAASQHFASLDTGSPCPCHRWAPVPACWGPCHFSSFCVHSQTIYSDSKIWREPRISTLVFPSIPGLQATTQVSHFTGSKSLHSKPSPLRPSYFFPASSLAQRRDDK